MEINNSMFSAEIVWFIAGIAMLILELVLPGLIIFFFGIGAIITGLLCLLFDISLSVQLIIFISVSVTSLLLLRKRFSLVFQGKTTAENKDDSMLEEFMGKKAVVVKDIDVNKPGKIEFRGTQWIAEADEFIPEKETVIITEKDNITLKVKKI